MPRLARIKASAAIIHAMTDRLKWVVAICSIALFAPLAWPLVAGHVFWFDDLAAFHLPLRRLYQDALQAGDSVLWTSSVFSGFYLHGEGQVGLYHPLHQVLYRFLPLWAAFDLELLLNYVGAFAGMYWFMRRMRFGTPASLFAAMLFAFCGFLVLHHHHLNLAASVAHAPWLLAAIDIMIAAVTRRALAAGYATVALVVASDILVGFPQGLWFGILLAAVFVLFRTLETGSIARCAMVVCAGATGGLLGAIQLVPTVDMAAASFRRLMPPEFALSFSLHPANLLQLWSPYLFTLRVYSKADYPALHEFGIYSGAFLLIAPLWLWIRRKDLGPRRSLAVAALLAALVSLVLALGKYGGLYGALVALPGFGWGRASTRYVFLTEFFLVLAATIAFEDLRLVAGSRDRIMGRRLWLLWVPALLSVLTTALVSTRTIRIFQLGQIAPVGQAAMGTVFVIVVTALVALAARQVRWAVAALVLVTAADLGWSGIREVYRVPPQRIESFTAGMLHPRDAPDTGRLYAAGEGNQLVLNGFRLSSGYMALEPAVYFEPSSDTALRLSGTHWRWLSRLGLERVPGAVDRARLVADVQVRRSTGDRSVGRVKIDMTGVDVNDTAIVDRHVPPLAGPPGVARVLVDRPGRIEIETVLAGRQVLVLTERYHAGWQATANGHPVETLRAYGDFIGCVVEAGTQRVELRFMPPSFVRGVRWSLLGVGLLGVGLLLILWLPARG
jgi:membrane protein YfhO